MKRILKENMLNAVRGFVAGLAVLMVAIPSHVMAITLDDLITNDDFIIEGDKIFYDFGYVDNNNSGPDPAEINVSGDTAGGFYGLQFQGGFIDFPGPPDLEVLISYYVGVLDPAREMSEIYAAANLAVFGTGTSSLNTCAYDPNNPSAPFSLLGCVNLTNPPQNLSGLASFAGSVLTAYVRNHLVLDGGSAGIATLSFGNNWLSQVEVPVPEPATIILLGSGLLGIGFMSRKGKV